MAQTHWILGCTSALLKRALLRAWLGVAALFLSGCGSPIGATVTGLLTIDGKPAPAGVRIDFQPQVENASSSTGFTDARGEFEMMFNVNKKGVMPGESLVRIAVLPEVGSGGAPVVAKELQELRIPDSVGRNSTLKKTVKPGRNRIDIAIENAAASGK